MTIKTLICNIDLSSASCSEDMPVHVTKFGDGYEQRRKKGIAPVIEKYSASKTGKRDEIEPIRSFIKEHAGVKAFLWQSEKSEPLKNWVAESLSRKPLGNGIYELSWQMREVRGGLVKQPVAAPLPLLFEAGSSQSGDRL